LEIKSFYSTVSRSKSSFFMVTSGYSYHSILIDKKLLLEINSVHIMDESENETLNLKILNAIS